MEELEPNNPNLLSPTQFEREFGISLNKQMRLRMRKNREKDGDYAIPFLKIGNRILYTREAIMEWFSKLQKKGANAMKKQTKNPQIKENIAKQQEENLPLVYGALFNELDDDKNDVVLANKETMKDLKEPKWLIEHFLMQGSLNMMYASAGVGKSLFALE